MSEPGPQPTIAEATPDDVAALLRARTKDQNGAELGVWTDTTRPTGEQVQEQIEIARTLTRLDVGTIPDACQEGSEAVVALLAALLTEQSYWPEQVQSERSAYDKLVALYERARLGLVACVQGNQPGGDGEASHRVYDVCTPYEPCGAGDWPPDWWQRNLERAMP